MPEQGSLTSTTSEYITSIEFHHPKGNSLPGSLLNKLSDAITSAGQRDDSRVLVLRSKGDGAFCAGASFDELLSISDFDEGKQFFMGFAHLLNAMRTCPQLIISRIQGKIVGGGVGIAAAADYAIAHKSASIRLSELALGIGPFVIAPAITRKMGISAMTTLTLDAGTWHDALWAESSGLYNKVVTSKSGLDEAVGKLAVEIASGNPEATLELKKIMWQNTGHWESTLEQRAEISGRMVLTANTRQLIRKFKKGI